MDITCAEDVAREVLDTMSDEEIAMFWFEQFGSRKNAIEWILQDTDMVDALYAKAYDELGVASMSWREKRKLFGHE